MKKTGFKLGYAPDFLNLAISAFNLISLSPSSSPA